MGVQMYTIFGRQVGSHYLAMATLATTGAVSYLAFSGEKKPVNAEDERIRKTAESKEEEAFIRDFIRDAEADGAKMKAGGK